MIAVFLWLMGLSIFDMRYRRVPVWLLLLGGMITAVVGIYGCVSGESDFAEYFLGMMPGAVLLLLAIGTQQAGRADGIVLMLLGSVLGLRQCILATVLSLVIISVLSALLFIFRKAHKGTRIPYVPFLTMSFALCTMTGGWRG